MTEVVGRGHRGVEDERGRRRSRRKGCEVSGQLVDGKVGREGGRRAGG